MYPTEYNAEKEQERALREGRAEGREIGLTEGREEGISDTNRRVASDMLKKNLPLTLIEEISRLSQDTIRENCIRTRNHISMTQNFPSC